MCANHIAINKTKSTILNVRADRRQRLVNFSTCRAIPLKTEMKYLGVQISDVGDCKPHVKTINWKLGQYKSLLSM